MKHNRTESQKHRNAWLLTLQRKAFVICLWFLAASVLILATWLGVSLEGYPLISVVGLTLLYALVIYYYFSVIRAEKRRVYHELYGKGDRTSVWMPNEGKAPELSRVNVERQDGVVNWNVSPDSQDWSLDVANPIVRYMEKIQYHRDAD